MIENKGFTVREVGNGYVVIPEKDLSRSVENKDVFVFNEFDSMVSYLKELFTQHGLMKKAETV